MLNMSIVDNLVCQLVSWPFAIDACSWQQWMPAVAGILTAFALRIMGIGRLFTFLGGTGAFYLLAISLALLSPPQSLVPHWPKDCPYGYYPRCSA